jgi:hypothetical protein
MSEPLSIRLKPEIKLAYQELAKNSGMKQEDFISALLRMYEEANETGTVTQEKKQIRVNLAKVQTIVEAVIDRAQNQENMALEKVASLETDFTEEVSKQKLQIDEFNAKIQSLE